MLQSIAVDRTAVRTSVIVATAARTAARVQAHQTQVGAEEPPAPDDSSAPAG